MDVGNSILSRLPQRAQVTEFYEQDAVEFWEESHRDLNIPCDLYLTFLAA
jgi:hypothetical protein